MPHIIIEYAEVAVNEQLVDAMLQTINRAVADSGLFEVSHIKSRAYPFRAYLQAGGHDPYIHVQARIKSGRSPADKKRLGEAILTGLSELNIPVSVITVEIIDMDRESYSKWVSAGHR